jgi:inorganic pyrophosphatase
MTRYHELPSRYDSGSTRVVVESPRGSRLKISFDPEQRVFCVDRELVLGLQYPYDFGFVPSTLAEDEDPLDAIVMSDAGTYPGVVLGGRALGVVRVTEPGKKGKKRIHNDRVLFVPADEERYEEMTDVRELSQRARMELERFFLSAVLFDKKDVAVEGWDGPKAAEALIRECEKRWMKSRPSAEK